MPAKPKRKTNVRRSNQRKSASWQKLYGNSRAKLLLLACLFGVVGSIIVFWAHAQSPVIPPDEYSVNSILVRFNTGVSQASQTSLLHRYGASVSSEIPQIKTKVITVPPEALDAVLTALSHNPRVAVAEKNFSRRPMDVMPNDPCYLTTSVGYVYNVCYGGKWGIPRTQTDKAWTTTTGSATVAIVDSGIAPNPDLVGNITGGYNVLDKSTNTTDTGGHGTYVAGNVAEVGNNQTAAVGYCYGCRVMPIKVTNSGSAYDSDMATGVIWATDHGAKVINISYGGTSTSSSLANAVAYAHQHNVVIVAAAGNSGVNTPFYPAAYNGVISVGATSNATGDPLQGYSNYGSWVSIAAPAGELTTSITGYMPVGGTSLSSPVVAAAAALLFSAKPDASNVAVEQALVSHTDPCCSNLIASGRLNTYKAMTALLGGTTAPPADTFSPTVAIVSPASGTTVSGQIQVNANASDNVGIAKVDLYRDGGLVNSESMAPFSFYWDTTVVADGSYTLTAKAYDTSGNVTTSSPVAITVKNQVVNSDTTPPTVTISSPAAGSKIGDTLSVSATATDNVQVTSMEVYVDGVLRGSSTTGTVNVKRLNTRKLAVGTHQVVVKAYDAAGNVGTASVGVVK